MCDKNKEFWETNHKKDNRYWLTDSDPSYVYKLHGLTEDLLTPGQYVMEVGVGTGKSINKLAENQMVFVVDISEEALNKVKDVATVIQVHHGKDWPKDIIDIALCHLVFQHCDNNDFRHIIRYVLESLTPNGFFSFQSADAEKHKLDEHYRKCVAEGHMYFRSRDEVKRVVEEVGGKMVSVSEDILHPKECDIVWNIFRVKRV